MLYRLLVQQVVVIEVNGLVIYQHRRGRWRLTSQPDPRHLTIVILCPLHWLERQQQTLELYLSETQMQHITTLVSQNIAIAKVLIWPQLLLATRNDYLGSITTAMGGSYHVVKLANMTIARYLFQQDNAIEWQKTRRFCQRYSCELAATVVTHEIIFTPALLQQISRLKQLKLPQLSCFTQALSSGRRYVRLATLLIMSTAVSLMTLRLPQTIQTNLEEDPALNAYGYWRQRNVKLEWHPIDQIFQSFKEKLVLYDLVWNQQYCTLNVAINPTDSSQIPQIKTRLLELIPQVQVEINSTMKSLKITYRFGCL